MSHPSFWGFCFQFVHWSLQAYHKTPHQLFLFYFSAAICCFISFPGGSGAGAIRQMASHLTLKYFYVQKSSRSIHYLFSHSCSLTGPDEQNPLRQTAKHIKRRPQTQTVVHMSKFHHSTKINFNLMVYL